MFVFIEDTQLQIFMVALVYISNLQIEVTFGDNARIDSL
jgi:hypothetical protein